MNGKLIISNVWRFLLLMLLQVLVFNNIYLGGYINPCIYVLFIAMLPTSIGKLWPLVIAFFYGLSIDVSSNMLGFHTFACVLTAFARVMWFERIIMRDREEAILTPSLREGSYQQFALYWFLLLIVFYVAFYGTLVFSFRELPQILLSTLLSSVVTWILGIIYQTLFIKKTEL